jgi:N4-gp56 family major capsid protein
MFIFDLQLFAEAGTVTNVTTGTVNSYTGAANNTDALSPTMKTFYDTELLENAREKLIFQQLGRKQALPAKHGKVVEWRKWNTLPAVEKLQEGVIPEGKKLGMTSMTVPIDQYGMYVTISDQLELHAVDDAILGATEEVGASAGESYDKLVRAVLMTGANVMFADIYDAEGKYLSTPETRSELAAGKANVAYLTPKMINKVVTALKKNKVPTFANGKYVAVVHPSTAEDLRESSAWISYHQYSATTEIFNGEIGELHGVRFIESNLAPIVKEGDTAVYLTMFFGKDAFGVIDPEGAGMETIIKTKNEVGGPLNQFSTIGTKFSMGAKILYPERLLTLETLSSYSAVDEAN